jgi:hypothetical protein
VAAFSLWQLLNQRQPITDNGSSQAAQQQQLPGQPIGQSLIDFWNRAQQHASALPDWNAGSANAAAYPFGTSGSSVSFTPTDQLGYSATNDANTTDMSGRLNDRHNDCLDKCLHLIPSPSGDLQTSEFRKCYRECMGSLG